MTLDFHSLDRALLPADSLLEYRIPIEDPFGWLLVDPAEGFAGVDPADPLHLAADALAADSAAERMDPRESRWLLEPGSWTVERVGVKLWSKQLGILESVRDHHNTAVHTSHTVGKSFCAACAALWWIDAHPPGTAFVVTTAPSAAQVRAILWREMGRLHARSGENGRERIAGRINLTSEWYIGSELVALGRKPPDYNKDAFQGVHARYVLVIMDEACGIPRQLWNAASTLTSNEESRFLAIGNPDDPDTPFGEVCGIRPASAGGAAGEEYSILHISSFDTPNFTGEVVSENVAASLVSPRWVEERKRVWGERSSIYQSKVLGMFPEDADDGVIPFSWATKCRHLEFPETGERVAGLDVAGTGADRSVLRLRIGHKISEERVWHDTDDPIKHAAEVAIQLREWDAQRLIVDAEGVGHGVAGELRRLSSSHNVLEASVTTHRAEVIDYRASAKPSKKDYLNLRTEVHWEFRELVRKVAIDLSELDDDVIAELTSPKWTTVPNSGKIQIEPKKELKKRLGLSPDRAEAILLCCWDARREGRLPAPAKVLTSQHYATPAQGDVIGLGIAGPRGGPISLEPSETPEELDLLRELIANR